MGAFSNAIDRLRDYVAIPSVNPMGRDDVPAAIAAALPDAVSRHEELEASTQVGR